MNEDFLFDMETFFMALADKTRLRLLNLMRSGEEVCVCFFTEVLGESQPKISRHLAYLRSAGLVEARREGKWMHYRIIGTENKIAARILRETLESLQDHAEMNREYEKLCEACYKISTPVTISCPPRSDTFAKPYVYQEREELETFLL